jgi:hypothetical protein
MTEAAVTSSRRFLFVQFEFPWLLGPQDGRYTIRERLGEPPAHILVLGTLGAPERRLLAGRRRARPALPEPPPAPVTTSRATLVDTTPLPSRELAERRLGEVDAEVLADAGLARLNRVLHVHRVATADPYHREVLREQALVTRVGYGDGERVSEGRWEHALELAPGAAPRGRGGRARSAALRPQERLAAVLAGRDAVLACEELALRARCDLDAERFREAALQLRVALEAAIAELEPWRDQPGLAERLADLRARRDDIAAAANAALRGGLDDEHIGTVRAGLERVEAALRARTAGGRL